MRRRLLASLACSGLPLLLATGACRAATGLDFDATFNAQGEPARLHFEARYLMAGREHALQVWRDGATRLKRRTDDAIETFVFKPPQEAEWQMVLLDLKRGIRTDIARGNLQRIGQFNDWFSLSHALARPGGDYRLSTAAPVVSAGPPAAPCDWYALVRDGVASRICWSPALRLPMLIVDARDALQWRVTGFDTGPAAPSTFRIEDAGFLHNDANAEIEGD